jgi:hypothetical protein
MLERRLVPLTKIKTEPVRWLWPNRIPLGAITLLDGDPAQGKTTLTYEIAARVTTGQPMINCEGAIGPAGVVLVQAEDSITQSVLPGLKAAGADVSKIYVYDRARSIQQPLIIPADLQIIETAIGQVAAKLVVLDPLAAFLRANLNSEVCVRQALGPLVMLAERLDVAILIVRHLVKSAPGSPLYRGGGSVGIIAAARSALLVGSDPNSDDAFKHVLTQTKSNFSRAPSLSFRTIKRENSTAIEWLGESPHSAQVVASSSARREEHSALQAAQYVLFSLLSEGPLAAREVISLAAQAGVAKRTLDRAKSALDVRVRRIGSGRNSRWQWELPDDATLLGPFKEKDLDELTEQLLNGSDGELPPYRETIGRGLGPRKTTRSGTTAETEMMTTKINR